MGIEYANNEVCFMRPSKGIRDNGVIFTRRNQRVETATGNYTSGRLFRDKNPAAREISPEEKNLKR